VLDRSHHAEAGVGNHHVDPPEGRSRRRHGALHVAVPGDVAGDGDRAAAAALELLRQAVQPIGAAGGEDEIGAAAAELACQGGADPGRRAGDEDRLPAERDGVQGVASTTASSA
jgi:hypothetical protein